MSTPHWPNNLGNEVAKKRAQSLVEETRLAQQKADLTELDAVREALVGLKDRLARLITRHYVGPALNLIDRAAFELLQQREKAKENRR